MKSCNLLIALSLTLLFSSCSENKKDELRSSAVPLKSDIQLAEVLSESGCLSVPKVYAGIKGIDPSLNVVVIPTRIQFAAKKAIRPAFRSLLAYGALQVKQLPFSQLQELPAVEQEGCKSLLLTSASGLQKVFEVKNSTEDSIAIESEEGERYEFLWLSPRSLQITRTYLAYDVPCESEHAPIFISLTRYYDWAGGDIPTILRAEGAVPSLDSGLVTLAADAVGSEINEFYIDQGDGTRAFDVAKVNSIALREPRPELLSCTGFSEEPPAPAPDDPGPNDSNSGDDGNPMVEI